jgi:hypothetical protein
MKRCLLQSHKKITIKDDFLSGINGLSQITAGKNQEQRKK